MNINVHADPACSGACVELTVLLDATRATLAREVAHHGLNAGVRNSLADAVRALTTAQEDAHRRCPDPRRARRLTAESEDRTITALFEPLP